MLINLGYKYKLNRIIISSVIGFGTKFILAKELQQYKKTYKYSFNSIDSRWNKDLCLALGLDYLINNSFYITFNIGLDYSITPFILYPENADYREYIYPYSIFSITGFTYKF